MSKTPVTILAGFLGAGKTTLLNRILQADHGLRVAVLVNDFGEINIDSQLITQVEGEQISLANGCICCTIRDDLAASVMQVLDNPDPPEYIVIEASGVSDPAAVAMGLEMSSRLTTRVALDAVVTLIDAEHIRELDGADRSLAIDQIASADIAIINKTDLVDLPELVKVRAWIHEIGPQARVTEASHADVPLELLLGSGVHNGTTPGDKSLTDVHVHPATDRPEPGHSHNHVAAYATWSWTHAEPLAFEAVYEAFKTLPLSVFRAKGILSLREVPDKRVVAQMVGKRVTLARGEPWGATAPGSQIVVIGTPQGVAPAELATRFEACLAKHAPPGENRMADAVIEVLRR